MIPACTASRRVCRRSTIPQPGSWEQACAARDDAVRSGYARNSHPLCFCCSTALPTNRGLHVQCYPVAGLAQVAGPWICDPGFATGDGRVPAELVWTALDCPGQMAWVAEGNRRVGLLGCMTARLVRPVDAGARTVIIGWTMGAEGRSTRRARSAPTRRRPGLGFHLRV